MSKATLAQKVGVSRAYIGDLANGTAKTKSGFYRPNPEIVKGLAKALEVTEGDILNAIGYSSGSEKLLPEELAIIDYDGFDKGDLEEIADYIAFKRAKKLKELAEKEEK